MNQVLFPQKTKKIGVSKIVITRAEGPSNLCGKPQVYCDWSMAEAGFRSSNVTLPGPEMGYDKHDFIVYFQDGETYEGRLDVKQRCCPDNDQNVKEHVNSFMSFYAGIGKPGWMSLENYERALIGVKKEEYLEFLRKYDV